MKRAAENSTSHRAKKIKRTVEKYIKTYNVNEVKKITKSIRKKGFAVVNLRDSIDLQTIRNSIDGEIAKFPEYKDGAIRTPLGGFGAFGNPGSFHNPIVRALRSTAYEKLFPVLDALKPSEEYKKEAIIDRLLVREAGLSPSAESWHRDEAKHALPDDIVLGGWWNFDDKPNYLSCVKGSHKGVHGNKGFAKVSKEQAEEFSAKNIHVEVPPGHVLLFNEQLAHEVLGKKLSYKSYRLFLGWRLTKSTEPLDKELLEKLEKQAAMQIKSGQEPPMWAKLHWTNWVEKLAEFSTNFKDVCTSKMTVNSGKNQGKTFTIVDRHMTSLDTYDLPKYPPYDAQEIGILIPH